MIMSQKEETKQYQHSIVYNQKLPEQNDIGGDSSRYLAEIRSNLSTAVLENNTRQCVLEVVNLHKYILLYGLHFSRYKLIVNT